MARLDRERLDRERSERIASRRTRARQKLADMPPPDMDSLHHMSIEELSGVRGKAMESDPELIKEENWWMTVYNANTICMSIVTYMNSIHICYYTHTYRIGNKNN